MYYGQLQESSTAKFGGICIRRVWKFMKIRSPESGTYLGVTIVISALSLFSTQRTSDAISAWTCAANLTARSLHTYVTCKLTLMKWGSSGSNCIQTRFSRYSSNPLSSASYKRNVTNNWLTIWAPRTAGYPLQPQRRQIDPYRLIPYCFYSAFFCLIGSRLCGYWVL